MLQIKLCWYFWWQLPLWQGLRSPKRWWWWPCGETGPGVFLLHSEDSEQPASQACQRTTYDQIFLSAYDLFVSVVGFLWVAPSNIFVHACACCMCDDACAWGSLVFASCVLGFQMGLYAHSGLTHPLGIWIWVFILSGKTHHPVRHHFGA